MTIEQQRYDEALKRAKAIYQGSYKPDTAATIAEILQNIFPELRESEDEKIRKVLIDYFDDANKADENPLQSYGIHTDKAIAWLEKQGEQNPYGQRKKCSDCQFNYASECKGSCQMKKDEQKPANKVEPKFNFKVGQWIVATGKRTYLITKIDGFHVTLVDIDGNEYVFVTDSLNDARLWTIQDAKTGDVLVCKGNIKYSNGIKYERICLFNNLDKAFFTLVKTSNYVEAYDIDVNIDYPDNTVPATKEQREILFMAMANASYEWDAEKKELKKIEQKPTEWSEEDEKKLNRIYMLLAEAADEHAFSTTCRLIGDNECVELQDFLKSIKDRAQPKQEWSEEDIRNIENIDSILFYDKDLPEDTCVRLRNWLESLKPQNHWKPTEAQLASLTIACDRNDRVGFDLTQLLKEIKKL